VGVAAVEGGGVELGQGGAIAILLLSVRAPIFTGLKRSVDVDKAMETLR
jgi:hypothetical protein